MVRRRMRPDSVAELVDKVPLQSIEHIVAKAFVEMTPAARLSVAEVAEKHMRFGSGSGYSKPWSAKKTPYLVEPMNVLTSLDYQGMIFVGPARTGKTAMGLAWLAHTVICDPADMLYVHMNRDNGRKWSAGDLERFLISSPEVRKRQVTRRQDDNTFDKTFTSGMQFRLTYPTPANLSGITVPRVYFIDYERGDDSSVEGEGTRFDMGWKRTQTFGRYGMTVAEASPNPGKIMKDPKWVPQSPHEAPPIQGIFELYNRGDRRRYFWRCPQCNEPFEPDFKLLKGFELTSDPYEARESVYMVCPTHGCVIQPRWKDKLNWAGRWVPDNARLTEEGEIVPRDGKKIARSNIASFWLKGPAAGYQDWGEMVEKYLRAQRSLEETGDDGPLRTTVTVDQGNYYIPASQLSERSPEDLRKAAEDWGSSQEDPVVPFGTRFLFATCDVQKTSFVVQVNGYMANGDLVVIDSFKIRLSDRRDGNGDRLPLDPSAYPEDWDRLIPEVLLRTYALGDGSGRRMRLRAVGCDSGGAEGTTANAYNFWRRLRKEDGGLHRRLTLIKGEPSKTAPRAQTRWPDSGQTNKFAIARGDVPVLFLNSNLLKDQVSSMLARRVGDATNDTEKGGMIRYPKWMPNWFYNQLCNEIRTEKGWERVGSRRNEAFDLTYYAIGLMVRPVEKNVPWLNFGIERLDFADPPDWAAEWDDNSLVFEPEPEGKPVRIQTTSTENRKLTIEELGEKLG